MNIFIIGGSQVGKSTISLKIKNTLPSFSLIEMGSFFKENPEHRTRTLTLKSLELLNNNPNTFFEFFKSKETENNIIVGVRNPLDFTKMFNPKEDLVLITEEKSSQETEFEKYGLKVIEEILVFSKEIFNSKIIKFENFNSEKQCESVLKEISSYK